MQQVQTKIFVFSCHFPYYNQVSVTTNIKNNGLLIRIQDGSCEENSVVRRHLRANLRTILLLCWTTLKTNQCKKMSIYNTALKLARFIHIVLRKNILNFWQFPEYFGIFAAT